MQRLDGKEEDKKEEVIVPFFDKDQLDYFSQLPFELQYEIFAKVISIEIPQFFSDLSRLSPVSKIFLNLCQKIVERQVLNHKHNTQLRDNLMNSRNNMLNEYEELDSLESDNTPIFGDLNTIRDKILETKVKLRQGITRNSFILGHSGNRSCLRYGMSVLGVFLLPFIIYVLVRNSQCDGEILTTQGWGDNQTVDNRMHCLYAPLTNFGMNLFNLNFEAAVFVTAILFEITAGVGSVVAVAGLERLLHLLFDGIQLLILKYQEEQELIRLATDRTSNLYDICKEYVATIKWEEKIFIHANNVEAIKSLQEIKATDTYKLMQAITTLGNTYRSRGRQDLFLERASTPNQNTGKQEIEEPLLSHRGVGALRMV